MQLQKGLRVNARVGMHAIDHAQLIGMAGRFRKQIRNPQAASATLLEGKH
jgi:hypothetical protein